jgi:hypothetical protein
MFGEIMWNLDFLVFSLNFIVVSLLFYGFLSVLAWFVALFFTVLRIDFVVYCRLPCRFIAGKLLQLAVLLADYLKTILDSWKLRHVISCDYRRPVV